MDPNLSRHLSEIEEKLEAIRRGPSLSRKFVLGMASGAGYIIGGIVIIFVIGLVLNALGLVPGLGSISESIRSAVESSQYK